MIHMKKHHRNGLITRLAVAGKVLYSSVSLFQGEGGDFLLCTGHTLLFVLAQSLCRFLWQ
jgi:hypothetical protein